MPRAQTKLSRADQKQLSERRLIEAALAIAAESGVVAVTFESIAERAGYSRGLAFQKFGSKENLIEAVTDYLFHQHTQLPDVQALREMTGLAALEKHAAIQLRGVRTKPHGSAYFRFFASAIADKTTGERIFRNLHRLFRDIFVECLTRGQQDGSVRPMNSRRVSAEVFGSLLLGTIMQAIADPEADIEAFVSEITAIARARFAITD
jgi:AcrR family transcriptional regulator